MRDKLILFLLLTMCLGCSRYPSHLPATEQIEAILFEDLATYTFRGNEKMEKEDDAHRLFLSIGDPRSDAPESVLAYVSKSHPSARAFHLATPPPSGFSSGVLEKGTTRRGSILWIDAFAVDGDRPLIIRARRFTDGTSGELFEYRLERIDGQWRIIAREMLEVS